MAAFPGALATFAGFVASHTLSVDNHAAQHNLEQAEVLATQTKLGTGSSTPTNGTFLKGNGTGTSAWSALNMATDLTGILPVNNGGTGTNTLSFPAGSDTLVGRASTDTLTNKTLTTPTIGSFANANHDHTSSAGGGALGANSVTTSSITNQSITGTKLINGIIKRRKGGSASDWNTNGTTVVDTSTSDVVFQTGSALNTNADVAVTFPVAFTNKPMVIVGMMSANGINGTVRAFNITTIGFTFRVLDTTWALAASSEDIGWIAIGI